MSEIQLLIEKLVHQVIASEEAFDDGLGDVELANQATDAALEIESQIRALVGGNMSVLLPLLDHQNSSVRIWAATELLPLHEDQARKVLTDVAKGGGFSGMTANVILDEWSNGNWKGKPFLQSSD